jgi:hypothetical protein
MQLTLKLDIPALQFPITYTDKVLLIGSCFTEHISERLAQNKFRVLSNPHGILFNPLSVAHSLNSYVSGRVYTTHDLFYLNELWNSWEHHTRFSDVEQTVALQKINHSQNQATAFIKETDWVIITLGSAFQYYLKEPGVAVANNHRAPGQWFEKKLLDIDSIIEALSDALNNILTVNPKAKFLFTISPVRHIRDGVVDNNRSKARLIEAVHALSSLFDSAFYFPAYELVIDILRDYRFYDIDFVHPNYLATKFVWEQFVQSCIAPSVKTAMEAVQEIVIGRAHKPRFPNTEAHRQFKSRYQRKIKALMQQYPFLDLEDELRYFSE